MNGKCSCGAALYPDSLFCHKCGKPQRDLLPRDAAIAAAPVEAVPPPLPVTPPVTALGSIGFANRNAVRAAMLSAAVASLLMIVPWPLAPFFVIVFLLASGFSAVYLYQKRTGELLGLRDSVRLGWLTGLFCYLISLVLFVTAAVDASTKGGFASALKQQLRDNPGPGMDLDDVMRVLDSPVALGFMMVFTLVLLFLFCTTLPMIGGALGAKVLEKE